MSDISCGGDDVYNPNRNHNHDTKAQTPCIVHDSCIKGVNSMTHSFSMRYGKKRDAVVDYGTITEQ